MPVSVLVFCLLPLYKYCKSANILPAQIFFHVAQTGQFSGTLQCEVVQGVLSHLHPATYYRRIPSWENPSVLLKTSKVIPLTIHIAQSSYSDFQIFSSAPLEPSET